MNKIFTIENNLGLVEAIFAEMEAYLLSAEVFWPLDRSVKRGSSPLPRLTLGTLLITFDQLEAAQQEMNPAQEAGYSRLIMQMNLFRTKNAVAMEAKAVREAASRFNLWRAFVSDLEESPRRAGNYAYEVRHRVMLARLTELAPDHPELAATIEHTRAVDRRLRHLFKRNAFVWDDRLQTVYPQQEYWFLYGLPREND